MTVFWNVYRLRNVFAPVSKGCYPVAMFRIAICNRPMQKDFDTKTKCDFTNTNIQSVHLTDSFGVNVNYIEQKWLILLKMKRQWSKTKLPTKNVQKEKDALSAKVIKRIENDDTSRY